MVPSPLITVTGGTGAQGGSVARHLLHDGAFRVRCVVRDLTASNALELKSLGCELVYGDYDDAESIVRAFAGAWGVFAVTNYWELLNEARETAQGKTLVDAAQTAGVRHFVWSTMEHTSDPCAPHWNSKAVVNDYLMQSGVPYTSLYTVFYFENFITLPFFQLRWAHKPESEFHSEIEHSKPPTAHSEAGDIFEDGARQETAALLADPDQRETDSDHDTRFDSASESDSISAASDDTLNGHDGPVDVAVDVDIAGEPAMFTKSSDASTTLVLDFDLDPSLRACVQDQDGDRNRNLDLDHGFEAKKKRTLIADWPLLQSDGPIGGFSVAEIGVYALEAFKNPQKWLNASLRPISSVFTPRDVVAAISAASGFDVNVEIDLTEVSRTSFEEAGVRAEAEWDAVHKRYEEEGRAPIDVGAKGTGVWELWTNMESFYKHDGNPGRDFELTEQINPTRKSLVDFVEANIDRLVPPGPEKSMR